MIESNNSPLISIIVPVYNVEKWLGRCINSLICQTYSNFEVILIDDGSIDGSPAICDQYVSKDSRIKVIHKENGGVSSARNTGLDCAKGEYVCFVDSDDWIHKQYLEILLHSALSINADIVETTIVATSETIIEEKTLSLTEIETQVFKNEKIAGNTNFITVVTAKLFRYSVIGNCRFSEGVHYSEDTLFMGTICYLNKQLVCGVIGLPLYFYFHHSGSLAHSYHKALAIPTVNVFWDFLQDKDTGWSYTILLETSLKLILQSRYQAQFLNNSYARKKIGEIVAPYLFLLWKRGTGVSGVLKIAYSVFLLAPFSYRFYVVLKDPTMRKWEVQLRRIGDEYRSKTDVAV